MFRIFIASPGIKLLLRLGAKTTAAALLVQRSVVAFYQTDSREESPPPPRPLLPQRDWILVLPDAVRDGSLASLFRERLSPDFVLEFLKRLDRDVDAAFYVFRWASRQELYEHDSRAYNYMIKLLATATSGRVEDMDCVLAEMADRGYKVDPDAAVDLIVSYAVSGNVDRALWILGELRKEEVTLPAQMYRSVFKALGNARRFGEVFEMVEEVIEEGKLVLDETMGELLVRIYCKGDAVDRFLEKVADTGFRVSSMTLAVVVESLCKARKEATAVRLVDSMAIVAAKKNLLCCSIVCGVVRTGRFLRAGWIIRELLQRGLVLSRNRSSEASFPEAARAFSVEDFLQFFRAMNLRPSSFEYNSFLQGFCCASAMEGVLEVFVLMRENDVPEDIHTYNHIVDVVVNSGKIDLAVAVLDAMEQSSFCKPDAVTYTRMIHGFCTRGELEKALVIYSRMKDSGKSPDVVSFGCLINGFCKALKFDEAVIVLNASLDAGLEPDEVTYSSFIDPLCNLEQWDAALTVFELATQRKCPGSIYLYSRLMKCLCKAGKIDEAVLLLQDMSSGGETKSGRVLGGQVCQPTLVIYNSVVAGLCGQGRINEASEVVKCMEARGIQPDVITCTSFLQAFCKSGMVEEACKLLETMVTSSDCRPDTIACNALVAALCSADRVEDACSLFQAMVEHGIEPDAFTFAWIIAALCRSKRMEAAMLLFEYMKVVKCEPELVTYKELVFGLYAKGRLAEAKMFVDQEAKGFSLRSAGKSLVSELHGIINVKQRRQLDIVLSHTY